MSDLANSVVLKSQYWIRCSVGVGVCLKEALIDILHSSTTVALAKTEQQLHVLLSNFKIQEEGNLRRVINDHQWDKICHTCSSNCQIIPCPRYGKTNLQNLDITCIIILIIHLTTLQPPQGKKGWKQVVPQIGDVTIAAFVLLARQLRNDLIHSSLNELCTQPQFDSFWKRIEDILTGLRYSKMVLFNEMKTNSLDPYLQQQVILIYNSLQDRYEHLIQQKCDKADFDDLQQETVRKSDLVPLLEKINELEKNQGTKSHLLFIGNPGVGKSTLLNCIMKARNKNLQEGDFFESGVSGFSGMTYQLDTKTFGNVTYLDTPGLQDIERRKAAAIAITKALKKNNYYQVVFVLTLAAGRIRSSDMATMKLVLDSAEEISHYGVIINKVSKGVMNELTESKKLELKMQITIHQDRKPVPFLFFEKLYPELVDKEDAITDLPDLEKFIDGLSPVNVHDCNVKEIPTKRFEELKNTMETELERLQHENKQHKEIEKNLKCWIKKLEDEVGILEQKMKSAVEGEENKQIEMQGFKEQIQLLSDQIQLFSDQLEETKATLEIKTSSSSRLCLKVFCC